GRAVCGAGKTVAKKQWFHSCAARSQFCLWPNQVSLLDSRHKFAELRHRPPYVWRAIVPLRWQEVVVPLIVIVSLIILKYLPFTAGLPLARAAGVVAFGYAAFLALRLVQSEEAISADG